MSGPVVEGQHFPVESANTEPLSQDKFQSAFAASAAFGVRRLDAAFFRRRTTISAEKRTFKPPHSQISRPRRKGLTCRKIFNSLILVAPFMKKTCLFAVLLVLGCVAFPHRSPAPLDRYAGRRRELQRARRGGCHPRPEGRPDPIRQGVGTREKRRHRQRHRRLQENRPPFPEVHRRLQRAIQDRRTAPKNATTSDGAAIAYEKAHQGLSPQHGLQQLARKASSASARRTSKATKQKVFGVSTLPSRDRAIAIYKIIVSNAPFQPVRAAGAVQHRPGVPTPERDLKEAIIWPIRWSWISTRPIPSAADALYQIAFSTTWISQPHRQQRPQPPQSKARESFEDYLAAYPNSEKAAQAKENLSTRSPRSRRAVRSSIAEYYYKQKQFRAAVVYYNDVIRQEPNSPDSDRAKKAAGRRSAPSTATSISPTRPGTAVAGAPAGAKGGVTPKLGDGRLQAQTDTAQRPDYVGPPISRAHPAAGRRESGGLPAATQRWRQWQRPRCVGPRPRRPPRRPRRRCRRASSLPCRRNKGGAERP